MPREKKEATSYEAARLARIVDELPLASALSNKAVAVPEVGAPRLDGIEVTVPLADDVTEDDVAARLHELVRAHAQKRTRAGGELAGPGDDALVDIVGYSGGRLIPFSIRQDLWLELLPLPALPGLVEALVGSAVGDTLEVELRLPPSYPVPALAGEKAVFLVDLKSAREVKEPSAESAAFLQAAGRGGDLPTLVQSIVDELEAELSYELRQVAQELVLDEVIKRANPKVSEELVNEEIRRRWGKREGPLLVEKNFSAEEQTEALAGWLNDPLTRADVSRRLQIAVTLKAIAKQEKLELDANAMKALIDETSQQFELDPEQLRQAIAAGEGDEQVMRTAALHLLTVRHVMSRATIHFATE